MSEENQPDLGITELRVGALATHELFTEYVVVGFTRAEALQLIIAILKKPAMPE